jgi:hypothetical protein
MTTLDAREFRPHAVATPEAAAFHSLTPITPDYPELPIADGFNWTEALAAIETGVWYIVAFRSVRSASADTAVLTEFDNRAHEEAMAHEGLLFYFQGHLNLRRECLSFCVWETQHHAQCASRLPQHQAAVAITAQMYDRYRLERYWLRKDRALGALTFERIVNEPTHA